MTSEATAPTAVHGLTPTATSKPRRRKPPAAEPNGGTRERILRSTLRVIGEEGVGAVSNRRIAAEAGVALGSLTYHFRGQNALLRESLMLYVNEEVVRLSAIADALRASDPTVEQAAAEVERVASAELRPEAIAELELHLQAARDPELREASKRCFAAYDDVAGAALDALGVPSAEQNASMVVALLSGYGLRRAGTGQRDASGLASALITLLRGMQAE